MGLRNTAARYGSVAKAFHWAVAGLILYLLYLGLTMHDLPVGVEKIRQYGLHKSLGITVLTLAALRLLWRFSGPSPALLGTPPRYQRLLAMGTHGTLYTLMLAMPLSGWIMSSAAGFPVSVFGWFTLPNLAATSPQTQTLFHEVHEVLAYSLMALIALHVLASLYHHFYLKDGTLRRMLPFVSA
jgi:cytochrome b561